MSKQLPYYQFEPAEHLAGDIQMCSLAAQGLFENIKCVYWIKGCELTLKQLKGRFNEPELIKELTENNILKINDQEICIDFLDVQFNEITKRKKLLSEAGKKGWLLKKKKQATLKPPLNQVKAPLKQLDKIIEDNINIYVSFLKHFNETVGRNFRGCAKSKRNFYARIKQGYTIKDFQKAIVSAKADKFHVDNDYKYITPEFITRQDKLDRYINQTPKRYTSIV
jgi:uncharacterized phage protein (TIGR02220 family)